MKNRIPELDGVRGIAVLLVFAYHLLAQKIHFGWIGVDVFFVLSGFLITSILFDEYASTGRLRLGAFYGRRALRLWPALTAYLICWAIWRAAQGDDWLAPFILAQTYLANWAIILDWSAVVPGHLWSLAIEEHFYLAWPALLLALLRLRAKASAAILIAIICGIAIWRGYLFTINPANPNRAYIATDTRLDELLIGCLAAFAYRANWRVPRWLVSIAGLILLSFASTTLWPKDSYKLIQFTVIGCCVAACLLWLLQNQRSIAGRFLRLRFLTWTGRLSYSLYLWHFTAIFATPYLLGRWSLPATVFCIALGYAFAAASYYLVERPFLRVKDRRYIAKSAIATTSAAA